MQQEGVEYIRIVLNDNVQFVGYMSTTSRVRLRLFQLPFISLVYMTDVKYLLE